MGIAKIDILNRNYIRLANDLRKYYLNKEIEKNPSKCLTIDKLMDINEKFGSTADMQASLKLDKNSISKRMVHMLSDPFFVKNQSILGKTSFSRQENFNDTLNKGAKTPNIKDIYSSNDNY